MLKVMVTLLFSLALVSGQVNIGSDDSGVGVIITTSSPDAQTFLGLTDTPSSFVGSSGLCAKVNGAESALEFGACGNGTGNGTGDITSVQGDGIYIYNGSNSGDVVLAFNETKLNSTVEDLGDARYIRQIDEGNLNVNSSDYWDNLDDYNNTQMNNSGGILTIMESWLTSIINGFGPFGDFFFANFSTSFDNNFSAKTTDDLTEGTTNLYDNKSWNQSHADTLYYSIDNPNNYINETNDTSKNASGPYLYNDSTTIYFNETKLNITIDNRSAGGDNASWNESYATTSKSCECYYHTYDSCCSNEP